MYYIPLINLNGKIISNNKIYSTKYFCLLFLLTFIFCLHFLIQKWPNKNIFINSQNFLNKNLINKSNLIFERKSLLEECIENENNRLVI